MSTSKVARSENTTESTQPTEELEDMGTLRLAMWNRRFTYNTPFCFSESRKHAFWGVKETKRKLK